MSNLFEDSPFLERVGTTKDGIPSYRSKLSIPKSIVENQGTGNGSNLRAHRYVSPCTPHIQSPREGQPEK
jgi:hypothetical protein